MDYRKLIPSRKLRIQILNLLNWVPDKLMLRLQYRIQLGRKLNLKNPKRYTEKLQLYKMKYRNPVMSECVDKYNVRRYIENKGLSDSLNTIYGVFDSANDIDFTTLPNEFVIKTTDGGGGNNVMICKDKSQLDIEQTIATVNSWLQRRGSSVGREWAYYGIKSARVIVEKLLVNHSNPESGIEDFKIFCFNGRAHYIVVDIDRYTHHKRNFYNTKWENQNIGTDCDKIVNEYPRPANLDKMLTIAETLSSDFPFVRVDLYNINGEIVFGELTFYPWSGYVQFTPDSFDYELGRLFDISSFN